MMEAVLLLIGTFVSVVGLVVGGCLLALLVGAWETWWLLPLWDWSVVAIGGPAVTFGQLLCLQVMVSAFLPRHVALPEKEKPGANTIRLSLSLLTPVSAYYGIVAYRWWVN